MFISSKFACISLLAAVLCVIVCTPEAKPQIPQSSHMDLNSSKQKLKSRKSKIVRKQFVSISPTRSELPTSMKPTSYEPTSSSESSTLSGFTTSENPTSKLTTSSEFSTSVAQAPPLKIQNPSVFVPPLANIHCFIDDKLRQEVELFHVIGVRYQDSKLLISGPGQNFNFHFFDMVPSTVIRATSPTMNNPMVFSTTTSDSLTTSFDNSTTFNFSTPSDPSALTSGISSTFASTTSSNSPTTSSNSSKTSSPLSTMPSNFSTISSDYLTTSLESNTQNSTVTRVAALRTTTEKPNFNSPLNKVFTDGVTVAWDEPLQKFHFLIPDKAFRHYQIKFQRYMDLTSHDDRSLGFQYLGFPSTGSRNLTKPYTCHYNVKNSNPVCVAINDRIVSVGIYKKSGPLIENRFSLPNYLSFDKFFSYADGRGNDFILIHHRGQWIYRIDYQQYLKDQNMFFKVFQLKTPDGAYQFDDFEHADEYGLVTKYAHEGRTGFKHYRYYYSLFSENSGLTTYCVHDKNINGRLMILGREKIEQVKSPMEALRQFLAPESQEDFDIPTMLAILFYCSLAYLSLFLMTQMVPNRRSMIFKDLRHTDREIQRLAPVIENIMSRVHTFLESTKNERPDNKKST